MVIQLTKTIEKHSISENLTAIKDCDDSKIYQELCKDGIHRPTLMEFKKKCHEYSRYASKIYFLKNDPRFFWIEFESCIFFEINMENQFLDEAHQNSLIYEVKEARKEAKKGLWIKNLMKCPEDLRSACLMECYERGILNGYDILKQSIESDAALLSELTWEQISQMIRKLSSADASDLRFNRHRAEECDYQTGYRRYGENLIDDLIPYPQDGKTLKLFAQRNRGDESLPWLWSESCSRIFREISNEKIPQEILSVDIPIKDILMFLNSKQFILDLNKLSKEDIQSTELPSLEECITDKVKELTCEMLEILKDVLFTRTLAKNEISVILIKGLIAALLLDHEELEPEYEKDCLKNIAGLIKIEDLNNLQKSIIHDVQLFYEKTGRFTYDTNDYKYLRSYKIFIAVNQLFDQLDTLKPYKQDRDSFLFKF